MDKQLISITKILLAVFGVLMLVLGFNYFKNDNARGAVDALRVGSMVSESSSFEKDIHNLIAKNVENDFRNDLDIKEINNDEKSTYVVFVTKKMNTLYEGLAIIEKDGKYYKLNEIDVAMVDLNSPFTKHTLVAMLKDGRNCKLIGGYINSEKIKEIHIDYANNTVNVIKLEKGQNVYMDYVIGDVDSIKEIVGIDENDGEIYSYR